MLCMLYSFHKGIQVPDSVQQNSMFRPVALPQNKFFESWCFGEDLASSSRGGETPPQWVGHVTYNYLNKIPPYNFNSVITKHAQSDIIGLLPSWSSNALNMYEFAEKVHPGFMKIWERLIMLLGYGSYRQYRVPVPFYCNYWIMKREWFVKYCSVASRAMRLLDEDEQLREWSNENANYNGTLKGLSKELLMEINGHPYYTYHPFIMERLVCFFAVAEKAKLIILPR